MLARLQRAIAIALVLVAAIWAAAFARHGHFALACSGALGILFGYAAFLAAEFAMLRAVWQDGVAPKPRPAQLLSAWWNEAKTAPKVFLWRQPFRTDVEPDHATPGVAARHGVVLVHGLVCNRAFWNPWMRELRAKGIPFSALNLEPVFGSIDDYASPIDIAVRAMEAATQRPVVLVGHSMGGIAIRAWLAKFDADARVRRVVTIASPHHGTWLARFGRTINGRQMRQRSTWLATLAAQEPATRYARFSCFFGHCDNIVFPAAVAVLPGALNVHIPTTAHVCMAFHRAVIDEVLRWTMPEPG